MPCKLEAILVKSRRLDEKVEQAAASQLKTSALASVFIGILSDSCHARRRMGGTWLSLHDWSHVIVDQILGPIAVCIFCRTTECLGITT